MISLVIPIYNESILISLLFERVKTAMDKIGTDYEVIFVDDGSTDGSAQELNACHIADQRFKVLSLSRNFGHQAAYTAGLTYAKGDYIAMMDGDLQDPPELITVMYDLLKKEAAEIVYGERTERNEVSSRKVPTGIFHSIYRYLSRLEHIRQVGNFSIMTKNAVAALLSLQEKNRYLPGLRAFIGFKQASVSYSRPEREAGESKMTSRKLVSLALDAIFSFSNLPVKICLYSGLVGILLIFLAVVYILIGKITGLAPLGWSSIILSIYFIGSVQLLSIGILGEYVYRIYKETQNRPLFFVRHYTN
jgi:glycosyltransferase involved in cell wall biosynthesis